MFFVFAFAMHIVAALSFLLAVFFAIRLYTETDRGWYWFTLVLSAIFFALPQLFTFIFPPFSRRPEPSFPIISEASGIIASLLFAVSCYGMYKTMLHIRKNVEPDAGEAKKGAKGARKR